MTDLTAGQGDLARIREDYTALTRRKRVYGGILLILFVSLMAAGFHTADDRNAGGFVDGWRRIFDYPAEVLSEALEKSAQLPGHLVHFLPALVETLNIAAAATLFGTLAGTALALLSTRGLAYWPRLIPLFRRIADICRRGARDRDRAGADLRPRRWAGARDDRHRHPHCRGAGPSSSPRSARMSR